jgi:hypothetical protein
VYLLDLFTRNLEKWYWGRVEKIGWTYSVRNEEVLHRVIKERNVLRAVKSKGEECPVCSKKQRRGMSCVQ